MKSNTRKKWLNLFVIASLLAMLTGIFSPAPSQAAPNHTGVSPQLPIAPVPNWSWAKTWGGNADDSASNIAVDVSGNMYLVGEFGGSADLDPGSGVASDSAVGGQDVFLSKFDAAGIFQWARTWGGSGRDVPCGVGMDASGNIYVTGHFQNTVDFNPDPVLTDTHSSNAGSMNNVFLSKFSPGGNFLWAKTWGPSDGGAEGYSLAVDGTNHIYVEGDFTGTTTDFNPDPVATDWHTNHPGPIANFDSYLSKFDSDGNFIWARTWGGEGYDDGPGVAVDSLGNVYVGGMYASTNINFDPAGGSGGLGHPAHDSGILVDAFLSKFDSNGNFQWVRTWGGQGKEDIGAVVVVDGANNVYIGGRFMSVNCDFDPGEATDIHSSNGDHDAFISKYDPNGNFLWAKTWGGTGWDAIGSLAIDGANNVYSTGVFSATVNFDPDGSANVTSNGGKDVFLSEFDPNGTFLSAKTWGGSGDDWGYHVTVAGADGTYVTGSFSGITDFDPGSGMDNHTSYGGKDAFLSKFIPAVTYATKLYSTGSHDGWVLESSEASNKGGTFDAKARTFQLGDDVLNRQYRAILSFDTSKLPAGAVIQSVTLRIKPSGKPVGGDPFKTLKPLLLDIKKGSFGKIALEAADFQARYSAKKVGTFAKQPDGWYAAILSATGITNINRSGTTQFRLYFSKDDNNNLKADYQKFFSGNNSTNKPELIITYTLP